MKYRAVLPNIYEFIVMKILMWEDNSSFHLKQGEQTSKTCILRVKVGKKKLQKTYKEESNPITVCYHCQ